MSEQTSTDNALLSAGLWPRDRELPDLASVRVIRNSPPTDEIWQALSRDERERANQFKFDRDRNAFVSARSGLRRMLGDWLNASPPQLRFAINAWGKPYLSGSHSRAGLDFSVTHSGDLSVVAVAIGHRIGVDVELRRPITDVDALASRLFGATVAERLSKLGARDLDDTFLRLWTAGEAYAKALGLGLAGLGGTVPIGFADRGAMHVSILSKEQPSRIRAGWRLAPLRLGSRHIGTLAIECDQKLASQYGAACFVRYEVGL